MNEEANPPGRIHITFLDGIRGFCALYVVFHHIYTGFIQYQGQYVGPSRLMYTMQMIFGWGGHDCVTMFICLSGFTLAIPLTKRMYAGLSSKREIINYLARRFFRIGPPYFVAIAFTVLISLIVPSINAPTGNPWDLTLPIIDIKSIFFHTTFIHSLLPGYIYRLSPQFWSIATEAQIYFILPFFYAPIAKKTSPALAVSASLALVIALLIIQPIKLACLHYIYAFSIGAFVADKVFRKPAEDKNTPTWQYTLLIASILMAIGFSKYQQNYFGVRDLISSNIFALVLFTLSNPQKFRKIMSPAIKFFSSKIMQFFGKISYSIYLVHFVLVAAVQSTCIHFGKSVHVTVLCMLTVVPVVTILIATIMQKYIEAPFMNYANRFRATEIVNKS